MTGPHWSATKDGTRHTLWKDDGIVIEGHWTDDCPEWCPYRKEKEMASKNIATWFTCEVGAGWVSLAPGDLPDQKTISWDHFTFTFTDDPMKANHFTEEEAKKAAWLLGGTACKFVVESDKFVIENLSAHEERIAGYRPVDMSVEMSVPDQAMPFKPRTFGWALARLRKGWWVSRRGWNGPGQFIGLASPINPNEPLITLPFIWIQTVQGDRVPWLASQTDILADDWESKNEKR